MTLENLPVRLEKEIIFRFCNSEQVLKRFLIALFAVDLSHK